MGWSDSLKRRFTLALALILVSGGIFGMARVARADPHAIFYTAIGQQQLFFNVLAALDQADYVETQADRRNLARERRDVFAVPRFEPETQDLIAATQVGQQDSSSSSQPGVSTLLTRGLTLEGNDLYTDQLVRELSAEVGRRVATTELLHALCDFALGLKNCDPLPEGSDANTTREYQKQRKRAVVNDWLDWGALPFANGVLGALSSGTSYDAELREQAINEPEQLEGITAYSQDIATWRNQIAGRRDRVTHEILLEALLAGAARPYLPAIYGYPYDKFTVSDDGNLVVAPYPDGRPADVNRYTTALHDAIVAPTEVASIAAGAADRVALQLDAIEEQGVLAQGKIEPIPKPEGEGNQQAAPGDEEGGGSAGQLGELYALLDLPAAARAGQVYSLPTILGLLDTSQQFASPAGADTPGTAELVDRPVAGGSGSVSGAQTDGQVAGSYDFIRSRAEDIFRQLYIDQKQATSPAANVVAGHLEYGALHVLDALTEGVFRQKHGAVHRDAFRPSSRGGAGGATFRPPASGGLFR
jgi:hypothetical protein